MNLNNFSKISTKKKALKLIYDPTTLLKLLYSKYGEIEEDYNLLYINQLIYETSSHYNIIFKEFDYYFNYDEYLKRWYTNIESIKRMPKIYDYYKNYHKFFCKPNFSDFNIASIMQNYGDERAELYYKDNFGDSNSEKEVEIEKKSNSLSSLDNDTNNKIIFDDMNKFVIEKNEKSGNYSMTMSVNSSTINSMKRNQNNNLLSTKRNSESNDSFEKIVHNLIYYKKKKNKIKNNNNIKNQNNRDKNNYLNNNDNSKSKKIIKMINNNNNNNPKVKNNKVEQKEHIYKNYHSNNIVKVKQFIGDNNILKSILKVFNTPQNIIQRHSQKNNLIENNSKKNIINIHHQRNKTSILNSNKNNINNYNNRMISSTTKTSKSNNKVQYNLILTFKDLIEKQNPSTKNKNKTIDSMSLLNNKNMIPSNIKLYDKINSNKNIILPQKNNYVGSKFTLVKNVKNIKFDKTKTSKQTSYNYYQNILNQMIPKREGNKSIGQNNNINNIINNNTYNTSYSHNKNNSISPINSTKDNKKYNNMYKNKLTKNQINNYNINFNNVFLTSSKPNTYIIDNKNNNNTNMYNNINNNGNLTNNNFIYSNILEHNGKQNKNLYVMNLKNLYNISRNKNNILINNNPLTQTEGHHTKIQNNFNFVNLSKNNYNINKLRNAKFINNKTNDSNYGINHNINKSKSRTQYKSKSKKRIKDNKQISNEINNFIKKTQINFYMRNKRKKLDFHNTNKLINTGESEDMFKKQIKNNKSFNCSKNGFSSSSISRKKNKSKISKNIDYKELDNQNNNNINKKNSLTSQTKLKSKCKRKIK